MTHSPNRYLIEIKDSYGWCDHSFYSNLAEALQVAKTLLESFPNLKVIDWREQAVLFEAVI